jgi:hypothetical protein
MTPFLVVGKATAKATADSSAALRNDKQKKQQQIPYGDDNQNCDYKSNG